MTETHSTRPALHSLDPHTPSSRPATTAPATSKLRDSCHACALSKVKCHKQKPTCSRCAVRRLTCEYFHTKRPGRKRESRNNITTDHNSETIHVDRPVSSGSQDQWANPATHGGLSVALENLNQLLTPVESLQPDNLSAAEYAISMPSNSSSSSSGFFFADLLSMPDSQLSSHHTGLSTNIEDFFASPIDLLELEPLDQTTTSSHSSINITKLLIPDDTTPPPLPELSPTNHNAFQISDSQMLSTQMDFHDPADSASCCLMPALDLMKRLSGTSSIPNTCPAPAGGTNTSSPSVQFVVEDNKQAIEAVTTMIKCACAEDGYLLTVLSMLVLKILARFATAVRKQSNDKATSVPHDEGVDRFAAQLVLGELHRVQRLINLLVPRLQSYKARVGSRWAVPGRDAARGDFHIAALERGEMGTAPFPAIMLEQVEMELRKAVSAVSAKIIHMLRQS
jgi:hypothetical protein